MGCALQCVIVSAVLRPNLSTANVSLDVKATVAATFQVWVSPPTRSNGTGGAVLPRGGPHLHVAGPSATWTANLLGRPWSGDHHRIIAATDDNGYKAYRVGHFYHPLADREPRWAGRRRWRPSGCSAQCISSAIVTTHDDGTADPT